MAPQAHHLRRRTFPDELYDLELDPRETKNLAGKDGQIEARLRSLAANHWRQSRTSAGQREALETLDPDTREHLRVLGYIK